MAKGPRFREETDSMGTVRVPEDALWGASTQRAIENFPIGGRPLPAELIHAYGHVKAACAAINGALGRLAPSRTAAILAAADEVARGDLDAQFPVDVFQTGSGTSTNMNVNEVIANRASQKAGRLLGSHDPVHPNDHVNLGQSSNDTFPTAIHVAAATAIARGLAPALAATHAVLTRQAREWDGIVKTGRTHLMDATPVRMGQVFGGYASQIEHALARADRALHALGELPIGGTAVGTGINTHPEFGARVAAELSRRTGLTLREAANHFEAQGSRDTLVEASGAIRTIAVSLSKIANDIRLMGSGPRCGLGELALPAIQPGSSIMPGKVNPVLCESVIQVAARVIGNDATIACAALGGVGSILELNTAQPVMAEALLESIRLLARATRLFAGKVLAGLEVRRDRCEETVERSLMAVTALAPAIGYETAALLAKEALDTGRTIRELALEKSLLPEERLSEMLDPLRMTEPHA